MLDVSLVAADERVDEVVPGIQISRCVIVIGAAEKRFGLIVDSLVGEEELVIKALPAEIVSSDLVAALRSWATALLY